MYKIISSKLNYYISALKHIKIIYLNPTFPVPLSGCIDSFYFGEGNDADMRVVILK